MILLTNQGDVMAMCTSCLNHIYNTVQSADYKGHKVCITCLLDEDVDKQGLRAQIDQQTEEENA